MTEVLHITTNLRKEDGPAPVNADVATILAFAADRPTVWRVQECETWAHVAALQALEAKGWSIYWPAGTPTTGKKPGPANAVPILWTSVDFELVTGGKQQTHPGEAGVTPARYVSWVVLHDLATGELLAAECTHTISQAFTTHPERLPRWKTHMAAVTAKTAELAKTSPLVVGGGDLNHSRTLIDGAHMVYAAQGTFGVHVFYDALWYVGTDVTVTGTIRIPLASDHDGLASLITTKTSPTPPVPAPEAPVDKMNPASYFIGAHGDHVVWLSQRLIAHGFFGHHAPGKAYQAGPTFTEVDRLNVADFQRAQGWTGVDADGFPGAASLMALAMPPATRPKAGTGKSVIGKARLEVGQHEGKTGGHWNNIQKYAAIAGFANGQAWCDTFVYAMAELGGCLDLWPKPPSPGCDVTANGWKRMRRWSEYPGIGAQVFFGKPADLVHTGLVVDYDATFIYTIEGNTNTNGSPEGDGVYARKRARKDTFVVGYGYPAYPGGIVSADPAFAGGTATPKPAPAAGTAKPVLADISHFQSGTLDFKAAKTAGIKAIVHKVTDGTRFVDELFAKRQPKIRGAGLKRGAYHFARPEKSSGKVQCQFAVKHAGGLGTGDVQLVCDLEKTGGLSKGKLTDWFGSFAQTAEAETGSLPMIYTPFSLFQTFGCRLWVARYSDAMTPPEIPAPWSTRYAVWQFSNGVFGHPDFIPGLGHVDLSALHTGRTLADLLIA